VVKTSRLVAKAGAGRGVVQTMNSDEKKVLVAVDGSNQSLEAVRYVSKTFRSQSTQVVLFHVLSSLPEFFYDLGETPRIPQATATIVGCEIALRESINKFMSEARDILISAGISEEGVDSYIQDREEGIARDIIRESAHGYSAVIVGRNGLNKVNGFVLGSAASKVIERLIDIPIIIVGGKPNPGKILLGLDKSNDATQAVEYVGTMLDGSAFTVTLFHVVRGFNFLDQRFGSVINLTHKKEWREEAKLAMKPVFEEARSRLVDAGLDPKRINTKLVEGANSRAGAIVEEATKGDYGTIVVGRRGVSKVYEFLMGRVSNKVIQMAKDQAVWVVP
jgi:nucleotide-binding universal stress UspA family protein